MTMGAVVVGSGDPGEMRHEAVVLTYPGSVDVRLNPIVSVPAKAFASWIAARRAQLPAPSSHTPSPALASVVSAVESTVKIPAAAVLTAYGGLDGQ